MSLRKLFSAYCRGGTLLRKPNADSYLGRLSNQVPFPVEAHILERIRIHLSIAVESACLSQDLNTFRWWYGLRKCGLYRAGPMEQRV